MADVVKNTLYILVLTLIFGLSLRAWSQGSINVIGSKGYATSMGPSTGLGFSLTGGKGTREISLGYLSNEIETAPDQSYHLESYFVDFHNRAHEGASLFWGARVAYLVSRAPERDFNSGLGVSPQLGLDIPLGQRMTLRLGGEWYPFREYSAFQLTLRFHRPR